MNALRPRAVSLGFFTDMAATSLIAFLIAALDSTYSGLSPENQTVLLATSPLMFTLGSLMTMVGGFVAGSLAAGKELANGFAVGALSTLLSFITILGAPPNVPFWIEALGLLILIPLAVVGGLLSTVVVVRR